ncbi:MAG: MaoC/PaaZ C-terminal domain-containing protein [Acetobacteraceae bacterium]
MEFATRFDPQQMHVDPASPQAAAMGGLIASGWHTAALMMRMLADHYVSKAAGLAGSTSCAGCARCGPGDTLRVRVTVLETQRSRSKPDRGVVRSLVEVLNQDADVVMSMKPINLVRARGE